MLARCPLTPRSCPKSAIPLSRVRGSWPREADPRRIALFTASGELGNYEGSAVTIDVLRSDHHKWDFSPSRGNGSLVSV